MTLAELRAADAALYDLLTETCGGKSALAAMLVAGIGEASLAAERQRVAAHLGYGELSAGHMAIALEAVASGASVAKCQASYLAAMITTIHEATAPKPALRLVAKEQA